MSTTATMPTTIPIQAERLGRSPVATPKTTGTTAVSTAVIGEMTFIGAMASPL
jgi:hypothetical protein